MHFLAADRLDRQDIRTGLGVEFERAIKRRLIGIAPPLWGLDLLSDVGRRNAKRARQVRYFDSPPPNAT